MTQQLEYFAFGKNNTQCFEKKKCTLSINTMTRIMLIQPVDEDIASIPVAFDRPFLQLKNHLYAFDLVAGNDLIIVFQMDIICSQVLAYIQKDKPQSKQNFNDLFKTRFLPLFCRRFMPLSSAHSINPNLIDEIIQNFGAVEKEMFADAMWEQRKKDYQQYKDAQRFEPYKQVSNNAEPQENVTTDDLDDESADVTISSQPSNISQIVSSQMQNNRHSTMYSQSNDAIFPTVIPTLSTLDPSQYILSRTSHGNPKIIVFISTDKKTCYEYSRSYAHSGYSYYCLGCKALAKPKVPRVIFTQGSDGSRKVQMDHSKGHFCQPRLFM